MICTGEAVTRIVEAYYAIRRSQRSSWVKIVEIGARAGLTAQEMAEAVEELMGDETFRAEPYPNNGSATDEERAFCPVFGGEQRHTISWDA